MCEFESSQKDESRGKSDDPSKAYRKPRAFTVFKQLVHGVSHTREILVPLQ